LLSIFCCARPFIANSDNQQIAATALARFIRLTSVSFFARNRIAHNILTGENVKLLSHAASNHTPVMRDFFAEVTQVSIIPAKVLAFPVRSC